MTIILDSLLKLGAQESTRQLYKIVDIFNLIITTIETKWTEYERKKHSRYKTSVSNLITGQISTLL